MPVIELPDGTEVEFPEGTPPDTMKKAVQAHWAKVSARPEGTEKPDERPQVGLLEGAKRAVQGGYLGGLRDEAQAALDAGADWVVRQFTGKEGSLGETYDESLARERATDKRFAEEHPVINVAGNVVGGGIMPGQMGAGFIRGAGTVANIGRAIVAGGTGGAVAGFGEGEGGLGPRSQNALLGAGLGAATGFGLNATVQAGRPVVNRLLNATGLRDPEAMAERQILRGLSRDGRTVEQVEAALNPNGAVGPAVAARPDNLVLPDVAGRNVVNLTAVAANTPGTGMARADELVQARYGAGPERIAGAVDNGLGGGGGTRVADEVAALQAKRSTDAAPLYAQAFEHEVTPEAYADLARFVRDPIGQDALNRGLRVIELEHLARGEKFNPADYGVTRSRPPADPLASDYAEASSVVPGYTPPAAQATPAPNIAAEGGAGKWVPVEGSTPNVRLMDAVKRGYDEIVEGFRDPTSGRLNLNQYGRAVNDVRATYRDQLAGTVPEYGDALKAWSGPSGSLDALGQGQQALKLNRDVVQSIVQRLPEGDREFFRLGVGRAITDAASNPKNVRRVAADLLNDRQMQARLEAAIPDPAQRAAFRSALEQEVQMAATNQAISPRAGSHTHRLDAGAEDMADAPPGGWLIGLLEATQRNGVVGAAAKGVMGLYRRTEGINPATASALTNRLLSTDPADQLAMLQALRARRDNDLLAAARGRAAAVPLLQGIGAGVGLATE